MRGSEFSVFLSLRFYVKSILENLEAATSCEAVVFFHFTKLCQFGKLQHSESAKIHKIPNSVPLNVLKSNILQF